jgi:Rrf2 family protein
MVEKNSEFPLLIAEIAAAKNIPLKFLENILLELKKGGFLESKKGKHGGYFFATPPQKIKLSAIFRIIEGPIALLPCVSLNFYEKCANCNEKKCGINRVMAEVRDNTLAILDKRTVADLVYNK